MNKITKKEEEMLVSELTNELEKIEKNKTKESFMSNVYFLIGFFAIISAGVAHHLNLLVLIQVESGVMVFLGSMFFMAAKYGMMRTIRSFFKSTETNEFTNDAIFIISSTGLLSLVIGIVITMGKLSEGKATIGYSVAAALVGIIYSGLFSLFYATKKTDDKNEGSVLKQKSIAINVASTIGCLFFMFMMFWMMSE